MLSNGRGALIAICASILSVMGQNIQKYSHNLAEQQQKPVVSRYWLDPTWLAGFTLVLAGAVGDFWALGIAAQTIVAAVGGGTCLVTNVAVAHIWNGEPMFLTDIMGVVAVVCGTTTLTVCGVLTSPPSGYSLEQLREQFRRLPFLLYLLFTVLSAAYLLSLAESSGAAEMRRALQSRWRAWRSARAASGGEAGWSTRASGGDNVGASTAEEGEGAAADAGGDGGGSGDGSTVEAAGEGVASSAAGGDSSSCADSSGDDRGLIHWSEAYVFAAVSGIMGSFSVLFAGCVAKLIIESIRGDNQFVDMFPFALTLLVVFSLFVQTHLLNMGYARGDIMGVFPVFMVFWIGFSILSGLVFYHRESVNPLMLVGFVCMMAGIVLFVQHGRLVRATAGQEKTRLVSKGGEKATATAK
eukprot:g2070.t1